jgi:sugar-phosphatase
MSLSHINNIAAVLFDMDGVVVNTNEPIGKFWRQIGAEHGVDLSDDDLAQYIFGCTAEHTLDHFFSHLNQAERQLITEREFDLARTMVFLPNHGALELLTSLKAHRITLALVTSRVAWEAEAINHQLGLDGIFDIQVTADDIQHGKPAPDCYLRAAELLSLLPEECLVFEDSVAGTQAAVAACTSVIGVQPSKGIAAALLEAGAAAVVADLTEVTAVQNQLRLAKMNTAINVIAKERPTTNQNPNG